MKGSVIKKSVFFAFIVVLTPVHGCLKKKSGARVAAVQGANPSDVQRREYSARVRDNLDRMLKSHPSPELQKIISSIRDQVVGIMTAPEQLKSSRTTVFVINSFPGGGKTTFINQLASALEIGGERKVIKTVRPDTRFLPMTELREWSVNADAVERGTYSFEQISPAILAFDEYTHTVTDAGKMWLAQPANREIFEKNGIKFPDQFRGFVDRLIAQKERYELLSEEQRNTEKAREAQRRVDGEGVGSDLVPSRLGSEAQESNELLWTATGDGRIDRGGSVKADDVMNNIRSAKEQVAKLRLELGEEQNLKLILDEEWKEAQGANPTLPPYPMTAADASAHDGATPNAPPPPAPSKSPKLLELEKELAAVATKIEALEHKLTVIYNAAESQLESLRTKQDVLAGMIAASEIGEWHTRVIEKWKTQPSDPRRQKARQLMGEAMIQETLREMDKIERIKLVFKADPSRFISELEEVIRNSSQGGKAYTGHIFLFLMGNVLPIQDKVIDLINRPGVCETYVNNNPNPSLRAKSPQDDPDCLRATALKSLGEPVQHSSGTYGNLAQELALRQIFGSIGGNDVAFNSRFANRVFMVPPSREQYAGIIAKEMDYWKQFAVDAVTRERPGASFELAYDPSILALLYRTRVEGQAGFRSIGGVARQLLSSFMVLSVTNALLEMVENGDSVSLGVSSGSDYPAEALRLPTKVLIRYDDATTSLVAVNQDGKVFDSVKVYLEEPVKTQIALEEEARTIQRRYFLAGELGIGTLLFGSPPPNDLQFYVPKKTQTLELAPLDKAWRDPGIGLVEYKRAVILSLVAGQVAEIEFFLNQAFNSEEGILRLMQARGRIEKFYEELKVEAEKRHKDRLALDKVIPANLHGAPVTKQLLEFARQERNHKREKLSTQQIEEVLDVSRSVVVGLISQYKPYIRHLADRLQGHEGELRQTVVDVLGRKEVNLPKNLVLKLGQVQAGEFNRDTVPIVNELIARAPRTSFWQWASQRAGEDWVKVATTLGFDSKPN